MTSNASPFVFAPGGGGNGYNNTHTGLAIFLLAGKGFRRVVEN